MIYLGSHPIGVTSFLKLQLVTNPSGSTSHINSNVQLPLENAVATITAHQSGSEEPSVTNYRKINGWTGVTVTITPNNLFDISELQKKDNYYWNSSGVEASSSYSGYTLNKIAVEPSTSYIAAGKFAIDAEVWGIYFYDQNGNWISRMSAVYGRDLPYTFTTPANCYQIAFQYNVSHCDFSTIVICKANNNNVTYSTDWSSSPGAVYGGYIDLLTGVLTVTYRYIDSIGDTDNGADWAMLGPQSAYTSLYVYYNGALGRMCEPNTTNDVTKAICTHLPSGTRSNATTPRIFQYHVDETEQLRFGFPRTDEYSTQAKLFTWLNTQRQNGTPFAFAFPLRNHATYQLTPNQIRTLLGDTDIFANCGDIDVSYYNLLRG